MAKFDTSKDGVWRTIRGRKVFIAKGQSLKEAMKDSGVKAKEANKGEAKEPIKKKPELKKTDKKAEIKDAIKKDQTRKSEPKKADKPEPRKARKKAESADSRKTAEIRNGLEKSRGSESNPKTPEDYLKAYMDMPRKNAETAKTFRNWRDVMWANSLREDLAGNAEKSEELSHKVYDFEDIARSLEGRETTAHMARRLIAEAESHSDEVLKDVQDSLKGVEGSVDRGIPFMTKSFKSMRRKLNDKSAEKKLLPEQYAPMVTDALRFTDMVDDEHYVESFNKMKKALEKMGYEMTEAKNTIHKEGADYRGLNTLIETPRGYTFELQFHTPQSFDIKEENHKDYEVSRRLSTSEEKRGVLKDRMTDRSLAVKTPKGAETIQNIERHRRKGPSQEAIEGVMKAKGLSRQDAVRYLKEQYEEKHAPYQTLWTYRNKR